MKKHMILTLSIFMFLSLLLHAKTLVPKVEPIIHNGIKYKTSHVGYIDASDVKSGRRQIYAVKYKPNVHIVHKKNL